MSTLAKLTGMAAIIMFIGLILMVVFGQVTVRKLRKNPKTKDALGAELVSGYDIFNVAQTLSLPESWCKKLDQSPLWFLHANSDAVREKTTKLDRILGRLFYWHVAIGGSGFIILIILDAFGVFG